MSLPFDLEDVVGVAIADMLRRVGLIVASVLGTSFLVCLSAGLVAAVAGLNPTALWDALPAAVYLFLMPVITAWGILYVPALIAVGFYFVKADSPTMRAFLISSATLGVLMMLALGDFDWRGGVVLLVFSGFLGGLWWLGLWWRNRQAILGEQHFLGVAIENQQRRDAMREEFGTDIPDRDYVVEEE